MLSLSGAVLEPGSMLNLLRRGDLVRWRQVPPADLRFGELVAMPRGDDVVLHRVVGGGRTKGDWLVDFDAKPLGAHRTIFRVETIWREERKIYQRGPQRWLDVWCAFVSLVGGRACRMTGGRGYRVARWLLVVSGSLRRL